MNNVANKRGLVEHASVQQDQHDSIERVVWLIPPYLDVRDYSRTPCCHNISPAKLSLLPASSVVNLTTAFRKTKVLRIG